MSHQYQLIKFQDTVGSLTLPDIYIQVKKNKCGTQCKLKIHISDKPVGGNIFLLKKSTVNNYIYRQ